MHGDLPFQEYSKTVDINSTKGVCTEGRCVYVCVLHIVCGVLHIKVIMLSPPPIYIHLHPSQPVSVPRPPICINRETSYHTWYVVTNY